MSDMDKKNQTNNHSSVQHIFIIGSKSIGQYGGFETFVDKLTEQHQWNLKIKYHVACKANGVGCMDESRLDGIEIIKRNHNGAVTEFMYHNAHVFKLFCPNIGAATALYYDWAAAKYCIRYCIENNIEKPVFYILTYRIGLFIDDIVRQIKSIGGIYVLNPDGHEWMRNKWSAPIRQYWRWSEKKMVLTADAVICDSVSIEEYIKRKYKHLNTVYISYGSDIEPSILTNDHPKFTKWLEINKLQSGQYYLIVGRFVPENNYEIMIREFMTSRTPRSLVIVTTENTNYKSKIEKKVSFHSDPRIKFVEPVYDKELLKKIRENAYGYLHGHEAGGTNPSLLEALGMTQLNLLLDVSFNREVGENAALYWNKEKGNLAALIDQTDIMDDGQIEEFGLRAKERIKSRYSWDLIGDSYRKFWESIHSTCVRRI